MDSFYDFEEASTSHNWCDFHSSQMSYPERLLEEEVSQVAEPDLQLVSYNQVSQSIGVFWIVKNPLAI